MISSFQKFVRFALVTLAVLAFCTACSALPSLESSPWVPVALETDATIQDLSFIDHNHGWLVGNHSTLMETQDGGQTWSLRTLETDGPEYRFNAISFSGNEGWAVGEPSILLHTEDGGQNWNRISLSSRLPGNPVKVVAVGPQSAEMVTDVGAIYSTQDAGQNWTALVKEAFGVTRNVNRSVDGQYVAVSSRGSFYSIWRPGQDSWEPHNRNSSKRVQNMGFAPDGKMWMLNRGGLIQFLDNSTSDDWSNPENPAPASGIGLLDIGYRTPNELWVSGGSGRLLCSKDGGESWSVDPSVENVPSNLYRVLFFDQDLGFITGQDGTLLRYVEQA
ncbi:photosynthesis system II assembly factor Ycf48 [Lyngbya confervoides]|uniref:Photosystem II assembly protein Ycf48 n=1 Tax=Lyngbya confervoides BDU141951 TaxID=1574623 RepID=A0ABD4TB27_9CYAN|nr:photosynthesis system II assembly factor Ycf48 [Lyngbya confervoides]MCM1985343.1 photosynthesis system II assembly factor Ycf48 [Lyngbya confervoides BDU141951]